MSIFTPTPHQVTIACAGAILLAGTTLQTSGAQAAPRKSFVVRAWTDKDAYRPGERVQFTIMAYNGGKKPVTLRFRTAQNFDFEVTPQPVPNPRVRLGPLRPVWTWSHNRIFAQSLTSLTIPPGAKKTWYVDWNQTNNQGQAVPTGRYKVRAWLLAERRYEAPSCMFRIASGGGNKPVNSPPQDSPQITPIDIRGVVTNLRIADKNWRKDELGSVLVEGRKEADTQVDRASVTVTTNTRVWRQGSEGLRRAAFSDLKEGDRVAVQFSGPVRESYPVGATAGEIVILPREK